MDLEKERQDFESWAYSKKWNIARARNMGLDHYVNDFVDGAWNGWLASANREGYKLVPLEATQEMVDAGHDFCKNNIVTPSGFYKAMIGACDDH